MNATQFSVINALEELDKVEVQMNRVRLADLRQTKFCITRHLNGCFAVIIISPYASIVAHIAPLPNPTQNPHAGDHNTQQKMTEVESLYRQYQNYFPAATGWVVAAVYLGEVALPSQLDIIRATFDRL